MNFKALGRHMILIYSSGDKKPAVIPAAIHREALMLQK